MTTVTRLVKKTVRKKPERLSNVDASIQEAADSTQPVIDNAFTQSIKDTNTNFLKIGDTVYTVKIVGTGIDIEQKLREFYANKYNLVKKELTNVVCAESSAEMRSYLEHLSKYGNRASVTIPSASYGKLLYYDTRLRSILECRTIFYKPLSAVCLWQHLGDFMTYAKATELLGITGSPVGGRDLVKLFFNNPYPPIPLVIGYSKKTNKIYTPFTQTFHTLYDGHKLCTGDAKPDVWWKLETSALEANINTLNLDSTARSTMTHAGHDYYLSDIINEGTITSIELGDKTWTL
jgi:hypothetical protein